MSTQSDLHVDVHAAVEFLRRHATGCLRQRDGDRPHASNQCIGVGFDGNSLSRAREFIERHSNQNLYWTVNALATLVDKKPAKADVIAMQWAHLDLDEPTEAALQRIRCASPPPSLIIFPAAVTVRSGGSTSPSRSMGTRRSWSASINT